MDRAELERLDREGLVARAQAAGIRRARLLTRPELIDELLRLDGAVDAAQLKKSRGFFGIAKDLLSRVVERGLHLPDAADRLRAALGSSFRDVPRPEPQAVPTVTLAEIYAAQGHKGRAIETLQRVLEVEPEHAAAKALLEKLEAPTYVAPEPPLPPEEEEVARGEAAEGETGTGEREESGTGTGTGETEESGTGTGEPASCTAIPLSHGRYFVGFRLGGPVSGNFVVRAVVLLPTWDGPIAKTRDVACDPLAGELVLADLPERAVVRVAVGVTTGGAFVPLAHSPALETSETGLVEWTLGGPRPAQDAAVVRAAELAHRHAR